MTAHVRTIITTASAAPTPHSKAIDGWEAEEGDAYQFHHLAVVNNRPHQNGAKHTSYVLRFSVTTWVCSRETSSGRCSGRLVICRMSSSSRMGPGAAIPSHLKSGGRRIKRKIYWAHSASWVNHSWHDWLVRQLKRINWKSIHRGCINSTRAKWK